MQLKEYQVKTIEKVKLYLENLSEAKAQFDTFKAMKPTYNDNWIQDVWNKVTGLISYASKKNGLDEYLPNFCLKVPTGGGKTLLAAHTIDNINKYYLKKRTGFVLWIVPTNAIYSQTFKALKNREHSYRQVLDLSSGGKTLILEKSDNFTPNDVQENLVVMLLMLPSANRLNKESLKIFQDAGGFEQFFPPEDDLKANETLLKKFTNLDCFGKPGQVWGRQIKTSLGNTLRLLQPIIIVDEGQKAYSEGAQNTIRGFNPTMMVELSATPPPGSNKLVEIRGQELNREQMIKLDINVTNKKSANWKDTLLSSVEKRNLLEEKAREFEANMGIHIRPICLIQVERTGKDQRGSGFIHSEDAKRYLIEDCLIPADQIAIKSSEKDDIEGIDLYSKDCSIRYIITKQALQEGWDCSFAYVLTILTNPKSENSITQLVGRILRQPNARKTGIKELDESYVFCFQQNAGGLMKKIKEGLEGEVTIREILPGEEAALSQLFYFVYGYNYINESVYYPEKIKL
ncbi:MAG: DEAD/DEAH box helicase family protein, partial [Bacteroidota bacterium]